MKQPHINCDENEIASAVIICGDPARVERIAKLGSEYRHISTNREFTVYETFFANQRITICSTGIGAPSALIALEELIRCGAQNIIRVGSAGALQTTIKLGELIVVEGAVRHDGASASYIEQAYPAVANLLLTNKLHTALVSSGVGYVSGLVRSHDSFYTDQEDEICHYWSRQGVLGADMESGALLTLGRLRGVSVAVILCNVVEYLADLEASINDYKDSELLLANSERQAALAALTALTI